MTWTEEQDKALKEVYRFVPNKEIAELLNRTNKSIRARASYLGLLKSYRKNKKYWTAEEEALLRETYSHKLNHELVDLFCTDIIGIKNKAQHLGLLKNKGTSFQERSLKSHNKKALNHRFFNEINTEAKAYFLGLFWADGCVTKKNKVQLKMIDRHIIESFKAEIMSDHEISVIENQKNHLGCSPCFCLSFCSAQMCEDLERYNIIPRKSYKNLELPRIRTDLLNHFIRGLFDGDGCITGSLSNVHVSVCGSFSTCNWVLLTIRSLLEAGGGVHERKSDHLWSWQMGGRKQVSKFAQWLYKDATFFLSRKYNKFVEGGLL